MGSSVFGAASVAVVLLLAGPVVGYHNTNDPCAGYDVLTFAAGGTYYLLTYGDEGTEGVAIHSFWLYEESNGIPGVQRGDVAYLTSDKSGPLTLLTQWDPCRHAGPRDHLVYGF